MRAICVLLRCCQIRSYLACFDCLGIGRTCKSEMTQPSIIKERFSAMKTRRVYAACSPRMGMPAAAILSMKMINAFRPRYIGVVGILAGIKGECQLGDVVAADPSWDWGSGKQHIRDGSPTFSTRRLVSLNSSIRSKLVWMATWRDIRQSESLARRGAVYTAEDALGTGSIGRCCTRGSTLYGTDKGSAPEARGDRHGNLRDIGRRRQCPLPQPKAFSIKSVCDFADPSKGDSHRNYAAYTSAAAMQIFVERYL